MSTRPQLLFLDARQVLLSAVVLAAGGAIVGGLAWGFLNTPESNWLTLVLSGLLAILTIASAGLLGCYAAGVSVRGWRPFSVPPGALRKFMMGLVFFALIWWLSGRASDWWLAHRGEADAVIIRELGTARTQGLHRLVNLALWMARWSLGLSVLANLTVAGALFARSRFALRLAIHPSSLVAAAIGAAIIGEGLWRLVYWRPAGIGAGPTQLAFVTVKLLVLYAAAAMILALLLGWLARQLRNQLPAGRLVQASANLAPPRA